MIEIKTMWFPSDTEKNGTRTEFPSGMDFGAGLEVSDIKFSGFFSPCPFRVMHLILLLPGSRQSAA